VTFIMLQTRIFTFATLLCHILPLTEAYLLSTHTRTLQPARSQSSSNAGAVISLLRTSYNTRRSRRNYEWSDFLSRDYFVSRSNLVLLRASVKGHTHRKSSGQPSPKNRKAIKWCVESVEKILREGRKKDSITLPQKSNANDDLLLIEALWKLCKATTQKDVVEAGRVIEGLNITSREKFSFPVQERVMKAAAMIGLLNLSLNLLYSMIGNSNTELDINIPTDDMSTHSTYIPSYMAYTAVLNTLRRTRKTDQMRKTIEDMASACRRASTNLNVVAFNTYLAALCDKAISSQNTAPENARDILSEPLAMIQPGVASEKYAVMGGPETFSFNTVLNAAASIKNHLIVNEIIGLMELQGLVADVYTYNARLKALQSIKMDDTAIAQSIVIIEEILASSNVKPDAYTIELALGTLAREGRIGDILSLLGNFNPADKRKESVSNAYTTFLLALVKGGEVECARFILDTYIISQSKTSHVDVSNRDDVDDNLKKSIVLPSPSSRHFNCVIEGYCAVMKGKKSYPDTNKSPLEHATFLFKTMTSMNVIPDAYTVTMMMGLQNSSTGVTTLWKEVMMDLKIGMTVPIFNSMMTSYGRVNDPSSACFVFDYMMKRNRLNRSHNSWNVLLSSLSKSSLNKSDDKIQCMTSNASSFHQLHENDRQVGLLPGNRNFSDFVDGLSSIKAAKSIFDVMKSGSEGNPEFRFIPSPNAQSYCLIASTLSHGECEIKYAMDIYDDAKARGIYPDGRFLNAILRCYGDRVEDAINVWKSELRKSAISYDKQRNFTPQTNIQRKENLIVTYHGLFHVAGRAGRADIALQLAYAMNKDGIEPTETAINCYNAGSKRRLIVGGGSGKNNPMMMKQYENLLAIECTKYDQNDKRRATEKRLKIII